MNNLAFNFYFAIGYRHGNATMRYFLYVELKGYFSQGLQNFPFVLYLTDAKDSPFSLESFPVKKKAEQLAHAIKRRTARHNRVVFGMTGEEP